MNTCFPVSQSRLQRLYSVHSFNLLRRIGFKRRPIVSQTSQTTQVGLSACCAIATAMPGMCSTKLVRRSGSLVAPITCVLGLGKPASTWARQITCEGRTVLATGQCVFVSRARCNFHCNCPSRHAACVHVALFTHRTSKDAALHCGCVRAPGRVSFGTLGVAMQAGNPSCCRRLLLVCCQWVVTKALGA